MTYERDIADLAEHHRRELTRYRRMLWTAEERAKEMEETLRYLVEAADNVTQPDYVQFAIETAREVLNKRTL